MNPHDTIAVTGVSSFAGAHLAKFLVDQGYHVAGGLSRPAAAYGGIRGERLQLLARSGVEFFPFDLLDPDSVVAQVGRLKPANPADKVSLNAE